MDLQETIVLRINREIWSHLATNYGPEGLQRTTHASSERHQWKWWTPSEMVSRLDLVVLDSAAAGWIFRRLFYCFWNIVVFIEQRGGPGGTRGGHNPPGRAWASWRALVGCALLWAPPGTARAHNVPSSPKKSPWSFVAFGLRLILISCDVKNMQKTTTSTWHYVNRLVPKNDIKWLYNDYKTSKIDNKTARNSQKL